MKPKNQGLAASSATDLTVLSMADLQFLAVEYADNGKAKQALIVSAGGILHMAPNGMEWLSKMQPLSEKFAANIQAVIDKHNGAPVENVPKEDAVDIIAGDMAKE
jgi:hypothetical protein